MPAEKIFQTVIGWNLDGMYVIIEWINWREVCLVRKNILIICYLILLVAVAIGGFWIGRSTADPIAGTTFYATVKDIDENEFLVNGLDVNDINNRGEVYFSIDSKTKLEWRHTEITPADLEIGDTISVTYTGEVQESYPRRIVNPVIMVTLLEDEK